MAKWVVLVALLAACGDDGPGGVTATKLTGFWNTESEFDHTVFAFIDAADTEATLEPTDPMWPANTDLAAVYQSAGSLAGLSLVQTSTYEVKDGALVQTVVGDINALPGTMYSTNIIDFDGDELTIESKNDPSGMRTYTRSERCANENDFGWRIGGYAAYLQDPNTHSPAIAIGDDDRVYSILGQNYDDGANVFTRFTYIGPGCTPFLQVLPAYRQGAMTLVGDEIHIATETSAVSDPTDFAIVHRWKAKPTDDWQEETIAPPPSGSPPQNGSALESLYLFENSGELIVLGSRTNGVVEAYRKRGTDAWMPLTLTGPSPGRIQDAAIGDNGDIAIFSDGVYRLRAGTVEKIPLPRAYVEPGGVRVVGDTIHAVWGYATVDNSTNAVAGSRVVYGIWDGTSWTERELGPMTQPHLAMPHDGKLRVIAGMAANGNPPLEYYELAEDGSFRSERISDEATGGNNPPSFNHLVVADGADGTIATSLNAHKVYVRHPERARPPRMIPFTVQINGTGGGRVYTDDGSIDCSQTCTTMQPEGTRLALKLDVPAGHTAFDSTCSFGDAHTVEGYCLHDVVPSGVPGSLESIATFLFQ